MPNKKIAGITVEIGADTTKLGKALSDTEKKSKGITQELREVEKALKLNPDSVELLTQKQQLLADAVQAAKDKIKTLSDAQESVKQQFQNGEIDEGQYRAFQREVSNAEAELKKYEEQAAEAAGASGRLGSETAQAGSDIGATGEKVEKFGEKVASAGAKMSAVSAGIVVAAKKSYDAWAETDEGYDTIITKTGATGDALADLQGVADKVFTSIPTDMGKVGTAVGEVNTRFGSTGEELEGLTTQFLKFAEINSTDVNSSIDNVSAAMRSFGMESDEAAGLLDVLTIVGQQTGIDMGTLESALSSNAATFKEMGLTASESAQLLGQFEINGVDTSTALAALKKAQQNAAKEGKSLSESLAENIEAIKNADSETEALQTATELFGKKGAAEMAQAIREGRFDLDKLTASMDSFEGATTNTFEATLDAPDKLKVTMNQVKLSMADLAGTAMGVVQPAMEKVSDVVSKVTNWFKSLTQEQKETILKITAVVAAIGPVLVIVGKTIALIGQVIQIVNTVKNAITVLNAVMAANPITIVIAAIVALIAILAVLYTKSEGFRNLVDSIWEFIKGVFAEAIQRTESTIEAVVAAFRTGWDVIKIIWSAAKDFFSGIWENIKAVFSGVGSWFNDKFTEAYDNVKAVFSGIRDFFSGIWDSIVSVFGEVGTKIGDSFSGAFKSVVNTVFEWVEDKINSVFDAINGAIDFINEIPGVDINQISKIELPRLAKGGSFSSGSAIVAEAGPELLSIIGGRAVVTPLSPEAKNTAISGAANGSTVITNYVTAQVSGGYDVYRLAEDLANAEKIIYNGKGLRK